jgi:transcription elongation factor GreA
MPGTGPEDGGVPASEAETRERLDQELAQLREHRSRLADQLGGEDPEDPTGGDRGDDANQLEGLDDLARLDQRIRDLQQRIAERFESDPDQQDDGLPDGTVVRLRFDDGDETTYRIVGLVEEVPEAERDGVLTSDSPLGKALAGHTGGDTVSFDGPDGPIEARLLELRTP